MDVREEKQQEVVENFMEHTPFRSTLVLSTGFGKSKVALDIIARLKPQKIWIIVNSTILRDDSWKTEFTKFNMSEVYAKRVTMVTYQYMYKQSVNSLGASVDDLVIADEVDFAGETEELAKFMDVFPLTRIIGLTGFITERKTEWFKANLPVFANYSSKDAQDDKLLNQIHFVFVKYDLSINSKDITVNYKRGKEDRSFTQSENNAYDYLDKTFRLTLGDKQRLETDFQLGELTYAEYQAQLKALDYKIRMNINKRSSFLYNSITTKNVVLALIKHTLESVDDKVIIFSKRVDQSKAICGDNVYNGKNSAKRNTEVFDDFNSGKIRHMGVVDKINRGANLEGLNVAIFESFTGSDTDAVQRFGRMLRLSPDSLATVYILLPYFMRQTSPDKWNLAETQQITWARNMLKSTAVVSKEVWDYRAVKEDPK